MEENSTETFREKAGHLFNDDALGNIYTEIDAKELMKTRERNAREDRSFQTVSRIFERAKGVVEKSYNHEAKRVRKELYDIQAKSRSLKDTPRTSVTCLAPEKGHSRRPSARPLSHDSQSSQRRQKNLRSYPSTQSLPPIKITDQSQEVLHTEDEIHTTENPERRRYKGDASVYFPQLSPPLQKKDNGDKAKEEHSSSSSSKRKIKQITKHHIEKARHISQALDALYSKRTQRRDGKFPEIGAGRGLHPSEPVAPHKPSQDGTPPNSPKTAAAEFILRDNEYRQRLMNRGEEAMDCSNLPTINR